MLDLGVDDPVAYVTTTDRDWADERAFVWAICIPTTGELIALIGVERDGGEPDGVEPDGVERAGDAGRLWGRARAGYDDALEVAVGPVTRFAEGALGLTVLPIS